MNTLILYLIKFIHLCVILFVVVVPFTNSNYLLFLHSFIVPFIIFHWITNNNMCALTLMEKSVRSSISGKEVNKDDCFTCRLIEPIYDFKNDFNSFSNLIYVVTIGLWLISVSRLIYKYKHGIIRSWTDLLVL